MKLPLLFVMVISSNLWAQDLPITEVLPSQAKQVDYIQSSKEEFVAQQKEMIEGKKLKLWGIALFSGTDLFSYGIKIVTESKWSHVGMVLIDEAEQKYSYESTGSAEEILYQGVLPQVQIRLWEDVVKGYEGKISTRQFKFTDAMRNDLSMTQPYVYNRIGLSYEKKLDELLKAVVRANKKAGVNSVFCSEEVAHFLIHLNYLTQERLEDNYLPKDFSQKEFIPLVGCSLNKEVSIKTSDKSNCCIIF
ncbi:hypothetical protein [Candidatus Odyssella acanthamoebae]|uniref:Uncharacterized protein n=1 Tax=Candidatus Odyssella acanthamoebae TaxID=91604 RepID=A0A077AU27_9PROT|nr:hypothetical protein [Candidatus Paracaedibacter acanthamoebae]AIK95886.1 hypothetical protein ID47_02760 [Candidatus Paracaedibacter acanthamoebae]